MDATPEELLLLANCELDEIIDKNRLIPKIDFHTQISKIILDTLRQNSKLLHVYNQVATNLFNFCQKFNSQREYKRLADTLHNHFQQLVKAKKNPDQFVNNKIPYPVKLDDPECQKFLLELRKTQIEFAIRMEQWTDAYRTSEIIFTLINKQEKKVVRSHLQTFFTQLSNIFFNSGNYLFHSYALMNQHSIIMKNTTVSDGSKATLSGELVFSALSATLNNRLSNFERLSTNYLPKEVRKEFENSSTVTSEILKVAQMLQIKGMPSHASLIQQIFIKNIHNVEGNPNVATLYKLVEFEESPFKISQLGSEALRKACEVMPNLSKYAPFIEKTLAIRILQKCKNFFTNVKFASLSKMMSFFGDWDKIEGLLYECNRLGLVMTIADHSKQVITFDQAAQVHENLVSFGNKLRKVFAQVQETRTPDRERIRIFEKIKGELDEEMRRVKDVKEAMTATQ
mmetsp:Transcript_26161/g.32706  ORF Transcript_26161/g.32706 Transcript_26161/m.32706 type:complete len:455 (+) Transcript_26161:453-1817(+)